MSINLHRWSVFFATFISFSPSDCSIVLSPTSTLSLSSSQVLNTDVSNTNSSSTTVVLPTSPSSSIVTPHNSQGNSLQSQPSSRGLTPNVLPSPTSSAVSQTATKMSNLSATPSNKPSGFFTAISSLSPTSKTLKSSSDSKTIGTDFSSSVSKSSNVSVISLIKLSTPLPPSPDIFKHCVQSSQFCLNGAECLNGTDKQGTQRVYCVCTGSYYGIKCQHEVKETTEKQNVYYQLTFAFAATTGFLLLVILIIILVIVCEKKRGKFSPQVGQQKPKKEENGDYRKKDAGVDNEVADEVEIEDTV